MAPRLIVLARRLGDRLRALGYDEATIRARLGPPASRTSSATDALAARRAGDDDVGVALRFWYLGQRLDTDLARAALAPLDMDAAESAALIERDGDTAAASVRIAALGDRLLAHDFERGTMLRPDHVLGLGAATRTLAALTPRDPVGRVLDLGTGNGTQAVLAAAHADHVFATDLNPRAVRLARLSAALNGAANIQVREGDAFEPVAGEHFDLVVANPPFVVSPDHELTFRDASIGGEEMSSAVVRGAADHLAEGGTGVILVNWVVRVGEDALTVPRRWTHALECDSLILHHDTLEPSAYAERWLLVPASEGQEAVASTLSRWLSYYQTIGARAIAAGAIVLRKTGRPARTHVLRMPRRPTEGGEHVMRLLTAFDPFAGPDDPELLATTFALAEAHELVQRIAYTDGEYHAGDAVLRLQRSAGVDGRIPADLLEALFLIDGERSLGTILDEVAVTRGISTATLRARAAPVFFELYQRGFLTR